MANPFYVGGYYRDRTQGYEVVEMSGQGMTVRYDDGSTERIGRDSMDIKARIYANILSEFKIAHPVTTDEYFWTLGFLAAHGRFDAELPNQVVDRFLQQYRHLSGEATSIEHPNVMRLGEVDKWGPELRIYFPDPPQKVDLGPGVEVRAGQTDGMNRVNNNTLWNKLIRIGFRVGKDHDCESIRNSIPDEKRHLFDEGMGGR